MKADSMNRWIALGANLAVLVGLFLLVLELRQTNSIARAEARNSMTQEVISLLQMQRDPRHISALERSDKDWESLGFEDQILLSTFTSAYVRHIENEFYQHRYGIYTDSHLAAVVAGLYMYLTAPYFDLYWEVGKNTHSAEFQAFVEQRRALISK